MMRMLEPSFLFCSAKVLFKTIRVKLKAMLFKNFNRNAYFFSPFLALRTRLLRLLPSLRWFRREHLNRCSC